MLKRNVLLVSAAKYVFLSSLPHCQIHRHSGEMSGNQLTLGSDSDPLESVKRFSSQVVWIIYLYLSIYLYFVKNYVWPRLVNLLVYFFKCTTFTEVDREYNSPSIFITQL